MYYIYDSYNEEWHSMAYLEFEDAEKEMEELIADREERNLPYKFDIYQKIT